MLTSAEEYPHLPISPPLFALIARSILGLALLGLAAFSLNDFPVARFWITAGLVIYAVALWWQPRIWMVIVPALLPVLDLAPRTGWFFFDESDLFLAVTVAVGYVRITGLPARQSLNPTFGILLALLSLSYAISAYIGLVPLPAIDANAFSNYYSQFNSLRLLKGFLWALLLLPLLRRGSLDLDRIDPYFVAGLTIGLAGVALVALWERWAFPGLLDFASDYRITATFSAMHTGGAALDGYLAMALPFTALIIFRSKGLWAPGLGIVLFALSMYALMVTFSRGLYLALAFIVVMMCLPQIAFSLTGSRRNAWTLLLRAAFLTAIAVSLWILFSTGGYRSLAASLCLLAASFFVGTGPSIGRHKALFVLLFLMIAGGGWLIAQTVEKGAYVAFGVVSVLFLLTLPLTFSARESAQRIGAAVNAASFLGMAAAAPLIAKHWGGDAALQDALWPVLLSLALPVINRNMTTPLWQRGRTDFAVFLVIGGLLGVSIPIAGNYYMHERMSRVSSDLADRSLHWRGVYSMLEHDWRSQLFGMGLGRFPINYFWKNPHHEFPGTYQFVTEAGNSFLRLGGPQYSIGYGETLRMGQRIEIVPYQKYVVEFDVRSQFDSVRVHAEFCEKLLLYSLGCAANAVNVRDTKGTWKKISLTIDSGRIGDTPWYRRRPVQFSLSTPTSKAFAEIDNVRIVDAYGGSLLVNGNFDKANSHWFFTSDRHHLPWHAKNLWLHVLFEQGWVGLILLSCLLISALAQTTAKALQGNLVAAVLSASLSGFLVVGLFDSLLDVPRSTLMLFLVLMLSGLFVQRSKTAEGRGLA